MRLMRALGPGSVSSFLKIILDVVFVALWVGVGSVALLMLAALLLSFNPDLIGSLTMNMGGGGEFVKKWPVVIGGLFAAALYLVGVLIIVARLRQIFATLMAGAWLLPGQTKVEPNFSLTAWFSVLVVFVLAEVFREGARLRREAELTI